MDSFIFSLNATIPVFFMIFAGWFFRKKNIISDRFVSEVNDLVFNVLFPITLFQDIAKSNFNEVFTPKFFFFCAGITTASFFTMWLIGFLFVKQKEKIGSFVISSVRGSAAVLGVAFAVNIYGNAGLVPLMIIASVPLYNIFSVILFTIYSKDTSRTLSTKNVLLGIIKNPLIIGIVLGIPFSITQFQLPEIIQKCVNNLSIISTPLALIMVGAGFELGEAINNMKLSVIATVVKLLVLPAIVLPVSILLGFHGEELVALLIMSGAPTTVSCYIMARSMKNDEVIASNVVVLTTLFSTISITFIIYILRSFSFI